MANFFRRNYDFIVIAVVVLCIFAASQLPR